ncbi:MAG: ATP-binding protein [Bacteroidales bacterium]
MGKKIAILGPECTGKTSLASQLARHFEAIWVPEYARDYVAQLNRKYTYHDVEHIAQVQVKQIQSVDPNASFVFFDTELIITQVWFEVVFGKQPTWLEEAILQYRFDLYLLTDTAIPWEPDPVRENGGEMREILFKKYEHYLQNYQFPYRIITGLHQQRLHHAIHCIKQYFSLP